MTAESLSSLLCSMTGLRRVYPIVCLHTKVSRHKPVNLILLIWLLFIQGITYADSVPSGSKNFDVLLQPIDHSGVLLLDPQGQSVIAVNADTPLVPASTMKLVLALMVLEYWGAGHHFETPFLLEQLDTEKNSSEAAQSRNRLWVVAGGDPFLVSEELKLLAHALLKKLQAQGVSSVSEIAADVSLFDDVRSVPGQGQSDNPYDALPSALSANFNSIILRVQEGRLHSGEPQTPLTTTALERAAELGLIDSSPAYRTNGDASHAGNQPLALSNQQRATRYNLGGVNANRSARYAMELLSEFILRSDSAITDFPDNYSPIVGTAPVSEPVYVHENSRTLADIVKGMLRYSTNFVANQLALLLTAERMNTAANFELFEQMARDYIDHQFDWSQFRIEEAAGLSRNNRLSVRSLTDVLAAFEPWYDLMPLYSGKLTGDSEHLQKRFSVRAKTGSLVGVSSLAGRIEDLHSIDTGEARIWRFAILLNGDRVDHSDQRDAVLQELLQQIVSHTSR